MSLTVSPITLREANKFVSSNHSHSNPVRGHKFSIGCVNGAGVVVGVAIVGRPVARMVDDGKTAEVLRVCTDGTRNACSMLYGAARRVCREMGYERVITYTLESESGECLRAAGFIVDGASGGGEWTRSSRPRKAVRNARPKFRWMSEIGKDSPHA